MTARSLFAALATGNSRVINSPELTPLTNAWFAQAAEAVGLPAGAVNILCGWGHEAGAALCAHPEVNQIIPLYSSSNQKQSLGVFVLDKRAKKRGEFDVPT